MFEISVQGGAEQDAIGLLFPAAVIFFAYIIRGMAGFGSALIAVPLLAFVYPLTIVVPLVVLLDYVSSAIHGIQYREAIQWKDILPLLPFALSGIGVSLYVMEFIDARSLTVALGVFVILFALYQLLPVNFCKASRSTAMPAGFFGGFFGTLFGTGGPCYVIYLNLRKLDKAAFRASFASIFLIDGAMRLIGYTLKGLYNFEMLIMLLFAGPIAGIGLYLGGSIHTALGREIFVKLISVLLLGSGTALLIRA